ncbi:MAG: sensor histidine kinase [Opitutaceae bacterium]|nr:sensor histidine kinase [Opitutaceae bacterium]
MAELSNYLATRRKAILKAWSRAVNADAKQTTASSLTRAQFNDHIPDILDAFERRLRAGPVDEAGADGKTDGIKHGITRWQQGYRLHELMHEWGHLHMCLLVELDTFGASNPDFDRASLSAAGMQLAVMVNEAISESAEQYEHMQQVEAASHIDDLMSALTSVLEIERRRSTLIHQAVHDLGNDVNSFGMAANLLGEKEIAETERLEFTAILQHSVKSVSVLLGELMELARLEAGQERRQMSDFDAAALVAEVCDLNRGVARARNLFLQVDASPPLPVEGDPGKVRRVLQNLMGNALKYTEHGGVSVGCGEDKASWWMSVKDTGPGLQSGTDSPLLTEMKKATDIVAEVDAKPDAGNSGGSGETSSLRSVPVAKRSAKQPAGEGIGLSIVKRLCDLLDASLEVTSPAGQGTMFKVVFPKTY